MSCDVCDRCHRGRLHEIRTRHQAGIWTAYKRELWKTYCESIDFEFEPTCIPDEEDLMEIMTVEDDEDLTRWMSEADAARFRQNEEARLALLGL